MPTYDYLCDKCGHRFEEIQKISDPPLTRCPKCKGKVRRLIHGGVGIIFKGSGFYVTDSRSSGRGGRTSAKDTGSKETAKTDSKSDSKSEPKTESKTESRAESKSPAKGGD